MVIINIVIFLISNTNFICLIIINDTVIYIIHNEIIGIYIIFLLAPTTLINN